MDGRTATDAETACFEAGIKFGSLYHQFAGTPVSPDSAGDLETAMETAIENQPFCEEVSVSIDREALSSVLSEATADYTELTGRFLDVRIRIEYEDVTVETVMEMEDGYPLMQIDAIDD